MRLRPYQREAVEYALRKGRTVLVLPTGTGKTLIGAYFIKSLMDSGRVKRALVIVPTRILVEQTFRVYRRLGIDAVTVYGVYTRDEREEMWKKARVAISTPETVYNDMDNVNVDAIVVDECHHAVGDDAYAKVLRDIKCDYVLGLTAFVPLRRRREIEGLIGEIREWPFDELKGYVSEWIGEIFEAEFNEEEMRIYEEIERRRGTAKGSERLIYTLSLKYFAKDGALALKESLSKSNRISKLLSDLKDEVFGLRDLHKMESFKRVLKAYEGFEKAIVFVDRVVVARRVYEELRDRYESALLIGGSVKESLDSVRMSEVIVSTSAGEEGVDLPTADLLINWSNTSSPLRFIQRHGRIMRKTGRGVKFVVYIVTPYTVDADDLISSIEAVRGLIDIGVDKDVLEYIWRKTRVVSVLELLDRPMPIEWIKEVSGFSEREVRLALSRGIRSGSVVYLYTELGKVYVRRDRVSSLKFEPKHEGIVKVYCRGRRRKFKGDFEILFREIVKCLPVEGLDVTVLRKEGDLTVYDFKRYEFRIDDEELLKVVLSNALQ